MRLFGYMHDRWFILINNWKWTIIEARVLYGIYWDYRPICYHVHIWSVMGKRTKWYKWGGYAWILQFSHLLGNETRVRYGKIKDLHARVILYKYMFIYRTVVNKFTFSWPMQICDYNIFVTQCMHWTCHFTFWEWYCSVIKSR